MLTRGFLITLIAIVAAGCDSKSPTAPTDPNLVVFTAQLNGANEVPAVTNAEANARGDVRITMNLTRDGANNITAATLNFVVNLNSFPAGSTWVAAHIHEGAPGIPGPVRVSTGLTPATAVTLTNGTVTNHTFSNIAFTDAALINQMIANPNGFYYNVHTALNPGGAVRGPLVKQ